MGLGRLRALWQIKAQGADLLIGHFQGVMEDAVQLGAVIPLSHIADDGLHQFPLGFQGFRRLGQRVGIAVEPCGVVAVLVRLLIGADMGQLCGC